MMVGVSIVNSAFSDIVNSISHNPLLYAAVITFIVGSVNIISKIRRREKLTGVIVFWTAIEIFVAILCPVIFPYQGDSSSENKIPMAAYVEQTVDVDSEEPTQAPTSVQHVSVMQGSIVEIGRYEQNYPCDGDDPVEWIVLRIDPATDSVLLLARKGLDCQQYHGRTGVSVSWEDADIRHWLNSYFLEYAFSEEERAQMKPTLISGVQDSVFLLDESEFSRYSSMSEVVNCYPTQYACSLGTTVNESTGKTSWWLRANTVKTNGVWVGTQGVVHTTGNKVTITNNSVRPAIWISYTYLTR